MKKSLLLSIIFLVMCFNIIVAQVGIGTTTPSNSAKLDVSSTNSGFLMPRMTMTQRNAIATPAIGLMVYQTDNSPGYYYHNGTSWNPVAGSSWGVNGVHIFNPNTGNVGIGTNNPLNKLHVSGGYVQIDNDNCFLLTNSTVTNDRCGVSMQVQGSPKSWMYWDNNVGLFSINTAPSGVRQDLVISSAGNVGIGTFTPTEKLSVFGGYIRLENDNSFFITNSTVSNNRCGVSMTTQGANKGWMFWDNSLGVLKMSTDPAATRNDFAITGAGNIGIGGTTPAEKLSVVGNVRIDNANSFFISNSTVTNNTCGLAFRVQNSPKGFVFWDNNNSTLNLSTSSDGSRRDFSIDAQGNVFSNKTFPGNVVAVSMGLGNWLFQPDAFNVDLNLYEFNIERGFFKSGSGDYNTVSDKSRKKDFQDLPPVLDNVLRLKAQQYHYKDSPDNSDLSLGFIAQDVLPLFPTTVSSQKDKNGQTLLTLNYREFTVIAIQAIQEQQAIIDKQTERIDMLEKRLEKLERSK